MLHTGHKSKSQPSLYVPAYHLFEPYINVLQVQFPVKSDRRCPKAMALGVKRRVEICMP